MEKGSGSAFAPAVLKSWCHRENLLPGLALVALAAAGWAYVAYQSSAMGSTDGMAMDRTGGGIIFLCGWTAMMVAMMVPATLPLILLYRTIARNRLGSARARFGMVALLVGYVAVWAATGMPVYAYARYYAEAAGSLASVLPASLLMVGGAYQFTPLKRICHARCSSPLFFLLRNWRAGASSAVRLGMVHGVECLGCCSGPDGGLGGPRVDEPGLDAHSGGHHLRREDDPREPPHRQALGRPHVKGRCATLDNIFARRDSTRDGVHVAPPLVLIHRSAWKGGSPKFLSSILYKTSVARSARGCCYR
jgi:hypothetical protein